MDAASLADTTATRTMLETQLGLLEAMARDATAEAQLVLLRPQVRQLLRSYYDARDRGVAFPAAVRARYDALDDAVRPPTAPRDDGDDEDEEVGPAVVPPTAPSGAVQTGAPAVEPPPAPRRRPQARRVPANRAEVVLPRVAPPPPPPSARSERHAARSALSTAPPSSKRAGKRRASRSPVPTPPPRAPSRSRSARGRSAKRGRPTPASVASSPSRPRSPSSSPTFGLDDSLSEAVDEDGDPMFHASDRRPTNTERYAGERLKTATRCARCEHHFKRGPKRCEFKPHLPSKCIRCRAQRKSCAGAVLADGTRPRAPPPRANRGRAGRSRAASRAPRSRSAPRAAAVSSTARLLEELLASADSMDPPRRSRELLAEVLSSVDADVGRFESLTAAERFPDNADSIALVQAELDASRTTLLLWPYRHDRLLLRWAQLTHRYGARDTSDVPGSDVAPSPSPPGSPVAGPSGLHAPDSPALATIPPSSVAASMSGDPADSGEEEDELETAVKSPEPDDDEEDDRDAAVGSPSPPPVAGPSGSATEEDEEDAVDDAVPKAADPDDDADEEGAPAAGEDDEDEEDEEGSDAVAEEVADMDVDE
ncbi:hypothetical protein FA95DRAFT_1578795 [Auriscalpium vulgare]|uniref:Uncharacterized protein n=1 Tax=Auriscalpium vulgare TaxID=40419 RepID=A0ACB8R0E1_9AGAM|nr:hypothetical protein FA95DRAFT_1578795 [Auriscalpium vulgare]